MHIGEKHCGYQKSGEYFSQSEFLKSRGKVHGRKHSHKHDNIESSCKGLPRKGKRAGSNVRISFTNISLTQRETADNRIQDQRSAIIEELSCWICQEEMRSEALLLQHYKNHMINIPDDDS